MQPFITKANDNGPEKKIQDDIIDRLKKTDWWVKRLIGNALQFGVPDLVAARAEYGTKWIEVKYWDRFSFTKAQLIEFPKMIAAGMPIYILFGASDGEMNRLFKPSNCFEVMHLWQNGLKPQIYR